MKDLLKIRKHLKRRKPDFIRQDAHKKKRVGTGWRKSDGTDSKMRYGFKGYRKSVSVGYKSPAKVRGLSKEGLQMVMVCNVAELSGIEKKTQGIIISAKCGMKKRLAIIDDAVKAGITILNIKDTESYIKTAKGKLELKKKLAVEKAEKAVKEKKKGKKEEKKEEKSLDEITSEEDKKKADKKEFEKLLTKKS